eukprot:4830203-Pyramimonas_sp.AAC.1
MQSRRVSTRLVMDGLWKCVDNFYDGCNHSFVGPLHFNCGRCMGDNMTAETWWMADVYESHKPSIESCVQ